eukprot:6212508-Pleurochrysis_carterae.AAC.2
MIPMWCAVREECTARHRALVSEFSGVAPTATARSTKSPATRLNGRCNTYDDTGTILQGHRHVPNESAKVRFAIRTGYLVRARPCVD